MSRRLLLLAAVALAALATGFAPSATLGGITAVQDAHAQAAPPTDPEDVEDPTDVEDPADVDDPADVEDPEDGEDPAPTVPVGDPEADDTAVGGLDETDLGEPIDETDALAADNPAPVAPAPTNAAPPVSTAPRTPAKPRTHAKVKWVRIRIRPGDTVRKIAKRRGQLKDAAAIVRRNRKVNGKRTLHSGRTTLRHGRGAPKQARKKDRLKLWVPAK